MLGIDKDGMKKVLTITIGENESAKYWMTVLNELKNRGVQDILVSSNILHFHFLQLLLLKLFSFHRCFFRLPMRK